MSDTCKIGMPSQTAESTAGVIGQSKWSLVELPNTTNTPINSKFGNDAVAQMCATTHQNIQLSAVEGADATSAVLCPNKRCAATCGADLCSVGEGNCVQNNGICIAADPTTQQCPVDSVCCSETIDTTGLTPEQKYQKLINHQQTTAYNNSAAAATAAAEEATRIQSSIGIAKREKFLKDTATENASTDDLATLAGTGGAVAGGLVGMALCGGFPPCGLAGAVGGTLLNNLVQSQDAEKEAKQTAIATELASQYVPASNISASKLQSTGPLGNGERLISSMTGDAGGGDPTQYLKDGSYWGYIGKQDIGEDVAGDDTTNIEPASLLQAERVINKYSGLSYDNAVPRIRSMIARYNDIAISQNKYYYLNNSNGSQGNSNFSYYWPTKGYIGTKPDVASDNAYQSTFECSYMWSGSVEKCKNQQLPGVEEANRSLINNGQCLPGFSRVPTNNITGAGHDGNVCQEFCNYKWCDENGGPCGTIGEDVMPAQCSFAKGECIGGNQISASTTNTTLQLNGWKTTSQTGTDGQNQSSIGAQSTSGTGPNAVEFGLPVCMKTTIDADNYVYCMDGPENETITTPQDTPGYFRAQPIGSQFNQADPSPSIPDLDPTAFWVYPLKEPGACVPTEYGKSTGDRGNGTLWVDGCKNLLNPLQCRAGTARPLDTATLNNAVPSVKGSNDGRSGFSKSSPYRAGLHDDNWGAPVGEFSEPRMAPGGSNYAMCKWQPSQLINYTQKLQNCAITPSNYTGNLAIMESWKADPNDANANDGWMAWPPQDKFPSYDMSAASSAEAFAKKNYAPDPGSCPIFSGEAGAWNYMKNWCVVGTAKWNDACLLPEIWTNDFEEYSALSGDGGCSVGWRPTKDAADNITYEQCNAAGELSAQGPIDPDATKTRYQWLNLSNIPTSAPAGDATLGDTGRQRIMTNLQTWWVSHCSAQPESKACNFKSIGDCTSEHCVGSWISPSYLFPANQPINNGQVLPSISPTVTIVSINPPQVSVTMRDGSQRTVLVNFVQGIDNSVWNNRWQPGMELLIINGPGKTMSGRYSGQWESIPWFESFNDASNLFNESKLINMANLAMDPQTAECNAAKCDMNPTDDSTIDRNAAACATQSPFQRPLATGGNEQNETIDPQTAAAAPGGRNAGDGGSLSDYLASHPGALCNNKGGLNVMPGIRTESDYVVILANRASAISGGKFTEEVAIKNISTTDSFNPEYFENASKKIIQTLYASSPTQSEDALEQRSKTLSNTAFTSYINSRPATLDYFHINEDGSGTLPMQICTHAAKSVPSSLSDRISQGWTPLLNACGGFPEVATFGDSNQALPNIGKIPQACASVTEAMIDDQSGPQSAAIISASFDLSEATANALDAIKASGDNNCCVAGTVDCTPNFAGKDGQPDISNKQQRGPNSAACQQDIDADPAVLAASTNMTSVMSTAASDKIDLRRTCGCYMHPSIYKNQADKLETLGVALTNQDQRWCYSPTCMFATSAAKGATNWDPSQGIGWKPGGAPVMPAPNGDLNARCVDSACISIQKLDTGGGSIVNSPINFTNTCALANSSRKDFPCQYDDDCDMITNLAIANDPNFPYEYKCVSDQEPFTTASGLRCGPMASGGCPQKNCRAKCTVRDGASNPDQYNLAPGDEVVKCWPSLCGCEPGGADVSNSCVNKKGLTCGGNAPSDTDSDQSTPIAKKMWNNPNPNNPAISSQEDWYILPNTTCDSNAEVLGDECFGNKSCNSNGTCADTLWMCDKETLTCKQAPPGTARNAPGTSPTIGICGATCTGWFCTKWISGIDSPPFAYRGMSEEGTEGKPQLLFHGFTGDAQKVGYCDERGACLIWPAMIEEYKTRYPDYEKSTYWKDAYKTSWDSLVAVGNSGQPSMSNEFDLTDADAITSYSTLGQFYVVHSYGYNGGWANKTPWFAVMMKNADGNPELRYFLNIPYSDEWQQRYPGAVDKVEANKMCSRKESLNPEPPPVDKETIEKHKTISMIVGASSVALIGIISIILMKTAFKGTASSAVGGAGGAGGAAPRPLKFRSRKK